MYKCSYRLIVTNDWSTVISGECYLIQLEFIILLVFCYMLPLIHKLVYNFSRRFTTAFIYVLFSWICDEVCQWFATGRWFSPGTPVSSTNKTDRHNITEIMFKVALNTITLTLILNFMFLFLWKKFWLW